MHGKGNKERRIALGRNAQRSLLLYIDRYRPNRDRLIELGFRCALSFEWIDTKYGVEPVNTLFASYEPTEDVVALLASLRQAGLAWIAEEIESTIRNGNSVIKKPRAAHRKSNGHSIVPFAADEQLRITLRAIQRYTVELHKIWDWTLADLRETLDNPNLQVSIAYLGSQESVHLFDQSFEIHLARLDELLRRAWPGGADVYDIVE